MSEIYTDDNFNNINESNDQAPTTTTTTKNIVNLEFDAVDHQMFVDAIKSKLSDIIKVNCFFF